MANRVTTRRAETKNHRSPQGALVPFLASAIFAVALSACASKRPAAVASAVIAPPNPPASSMPAGSISAPQTPAAPQIRPVPKTPPKPAAAAEAIDEVAEKLSSSFEVARTSPDSLSIRRRSGVGNSRAALFEQAIILSQIRAALKSERRAAASSAATFQRGTATVAFGPQVQAGPAAVAIAKALAIPGVNQVDASFARPPAAPPRF
jgi:hypothetical protein